MMEFSLCLLKIIFNIMKITKSVSTMIIINIRA